MALVVKNPPANAGDATERGSVPGLERSPEEGMVTHSSILAWWIPLDRGAWRATVHRVAKSQTWPTRFQSLSRVWLFATPWTAAGQASLSITNSWSLLTLMSIESVMPSNHLILCLPLLLLPSIFPSIRVFSSESALCIKWPKYWSFSFNISPSNEHSRLISFRMGWLNLLTVQGSLKSLLQHHSVKAPILPHSAFFYLAHTIFNSCIKSHKILWP